MRNTDLETSIFNIKNTSDFEDVALRVFQYQYRNVPVYREFCDRLDRKSPKSVEEIPFLPISFFKTHKVLIEDGNAERIFKSSGTSGQERSKHFVAHMDVYENSFLSCFSEKMSNPENCIFLALLPNYFEQGDSSLIYMVDTLIKRSKHSLSGFYLNNTSELLSVVQKAKNSDKNIYLFGVSYALLDLAEKNVNFSGIQIIETGGMKGRRKEIVREELHEILHLGLNTSTIYSEYGMTELLSQAYLRKDGWFSSPEWMKIFIRDINDALSWQADGRTGGVNVVDLANLYSCSFIATDDLGIKDKDFFKIMGRFDLSDIRGCNLLIN